MNIAPFNEYGSLKYIPLFHYVIKYDTVYNCCLNNDDLKRNFFFNNLFVKETFVSVKVNL